MNYSRRITCSLPYHYHYLTPLYPQPSRANSLNFIPIHFGTSQTVMRQQHRVPCRYATGAYYWGTRIYKVLDVCLRENRYHSQKEVIFRSVSLVFFRILYTYMESIFWCLALQKCVDINHVTICVTIMTNHNGLLLAIVLWFSISFYVKYAYIVARTIPVGI